LICNNGGCENQNRGAGLIVGLWVKIPLSIERNTISRAATSRMGHEVTFENEKAAN
jgi:hypothetical protein